MMRSDSLRAKWSHLLVEQAGSGLTKKAFCTERGINPATFYYWQRRLREPAQAGFHRVEPPPPAAPVVVRLLGGTCVELPGDDVDYLARVVRALDQHHA